MAEHNPGIEKKHLLISVLLALVALVSASAATVAWFTIADFTKVYSMGMEITTGTNLRFDLDAHESYEDYVKTLTYHKIAERLRRDWGYDLKTSFLEPVTTKDLTVFTYEDETVVTEEEGVYLSFELHFMATADMLIHLTSENSSEGKNGTIIESANDELAKAMRIGFTVDGRNFIYDPGMGDESITDRNTKQFGLPDSGQMECNDHNGMFWVRKEQDCPVRVHIWLEGTDPKCTDELRNADYNIQLRFVGTDMENNVLKGDNNR